MRMNVRLTKSSGVARPIDRWNHFPDEQATNSVKKKYNTEIKLVLAMSEPIISA